MSEIFGPREIGMLENARMQTLKTLGGALANTDEPGRRSIIEAQTKRLEYYKSKNDPVSEGKAEAIEEILNQYR